MAIDVIIVVVCLLATLALGIYSGRGIKSMYDYTLASRNYPTSILVATLSATIVGSDYTVGIVERVHQIGLIFVFCCFGILISMLCTGFILGPKLAKMKNVMSAGDVMEVLYGREAKIVTGICGALVSIGYVAAQVSGIGFLFHYFFDINHSVASVLGCTVVIIYSTHGGIKAVSTTDALQFIIMTTAIPMICNLGLRQVGGYSYLMSTVPASYLLSFDKIFSSDTVILFLVFAMPFLDTVMVQRILMAKNYTQTKLYFAISITYTGLFIISVGLIGLITYVLFPDIDPNLALLHLIKEVAPFGVRGIIVAGLIAVVMSSCDSYLNAAGVVITHDILSPILSKRNIKVNELKFTKVATFLVGFMSVFVAIKMKTLFDIIFEFINCWGSIIAVPIVAGVLGYKASKHTFYAGAIGGGSILLMSYIVNFNEMFGFETYFIPSMAANAVCFFGYRAFEKVILTKPAEAR